MEEEKKERSSLTKAICSGCAITILGSTGYLLLFGFELIALGLALVSFGGLATTSAVASEGIVGFFFTLIELFVEGISAVFGAIAGVLVAILSFLSF